jgi:hypothetical protein
MSEEETRNAEKEPVVQSIDGPPPVQIPPVQPPPTAAIQDDTVERVIGFTLSMSGRENLIQGVIILACVLLAAGVCALLCVPIGDERAGSALVGAFIGLVGGLLVSGTVLAIRRLLKR